MESRKKKHETVFKSEDYTFETAIEKLEGLVVKLENGDLTLDESLSTFEEGMKFARLCNEKLAHAESKMEELVIENGQLKTKKFITD